MILRFTAIFLLFLSIAIVMVACQLSPTSLGEPDDAARSAEQPAQASDAMDPERSPEEETVPTEAIPFEIVPEESEARFKIDEVLRGNPVTVVGVTSQVSGQILIDPANPGSTQVGTIEIDAGDIRTDSDRRNSAIRRFILNPNAYPFITFEPKPIEGLPESIAVGDSVDFQISGDLTIKDQTRPETFDVTVSVESKSRINGLAISTIRYADYGLFIPDVPFVSNVADELILELDFVAVK